MAAVAKHSCGSIGFRPTRFRAAAVLVASVAVSWIALPSSAPAADIDLTPTRYGALAGRLGPTERYGVVLPKGSKLRAVVSKAVLALQRDGTIRNAAAASFGPTLGSIPVIR